MEGVSLGSNHCENSRTQESVTRNLVAFPLWGQCRCVVHGHGPSPNSFHFMLFPFFLFLLLLSPPHTHRFFLSLCLGTYTSGFPSNPVPKLANFLLSLLPLQFSSFGSSSLLLLGMANWRKQQGENHHQVGHWRSSSFSSTRKPPLG